MKTNFLSTLVFGCLLLLSACANDDIATGKQGQKESDTAGMTSFSIDNEIHLHFPSPVPAANIPARESSSIG